MHVGAKTRQQAGAGAKARTVRPTDVSWIMSEVIGSHYVKGATVQHYACGHSTLARLLPQHTSSTLVM